MGCDRPGRPALMLVRSGFALDSLAISVFSFAPAPAFSSCPARLHMINSAGPRAHRCPASQQNSLALCVQPCFLGHAFVSRSCPGWARLRCLRGGALLLYCMLTFLNLVLSGACSACPAGCSAILVCACPGRASPWRGAGRWSAPFSFPTAVGFFGGLRPVTCGVAGRSAAGRFAPCLWHQPCFFFQSFFLGCSARSWDTSL